MILASGLQVVLESQNNMINFYDSSQSVYASGSSPYNFILCSFSCVFVGRVAVMCLSINEQTTSSGSLSIFGASCTQSKQWACVLIHAFGIQF